MSAMILSRIRWLVLSNGVLLQVDDQWPGPDGKPAMTKEKDPKTGEEKEYILPAEIGAIFFVKDESEGYPDPVEPDTQLATGEHGYYEVWSRPVPLKAAEYLGGNVLKGPCMRRFRIAEQSVIWAEEVWPFEAASNLAQRRAKDLEAEYEDLGSKIESVIEDEKKVPTEVAAAS
jgi:hypothetical protein